MIKNNLKNNKGFTMVETLVAVAILMISIAGPLTIAQKGLTAAIYAKDQVIATFLAEDAVEYIKNMRDENVNAAAGWLDNIEYVNNGPCLDSTDLCVVSTVPGLAAASQGFSRVSNPDGTVISNEGSGYAYGVSQKTQFSRVYYLKNVTTDEATLIVKVTWANGVVQNSVVLENQIFNIIR